MNLQEMVMNPFTAFSIIVGIAILISVALIILQSKWNSRTFPTPKAHVLTIEQMERYWRKKLNVHWRNQCVVWIYRIEPWPDPEPSMIKLAECEYGGYAEVFKSRISDQAWIRQKMGPGSFVIRIDRLYGREDQKREVCIANLEIS